MLARPADLVTLNEAPLIVDGGPPPYAARRRSDGALEPYPARQEIEQGPWQSASPPLAYLANSVELFLIQVQGSARLKFPDGSSAALTYDGRNGHPYTSVGQLLIERGLVEPEAMSLSALKAALRAMGAAPARPGDGYAGKPVVRLLSLGQLAGTRPRPDRRGRARAFASALHRRRPHDLVLWAALLDRGGDSLAPFPAKSFARLMIAQDTGSAILGEARADLYFGSGESAGALAGGIRHEGRFFALLPKVG